MVASSTFPSSGNSPCLFWGIFGVLALLVTVMVPLSQACSEPIGGYEVPTIEYKIKHSDVVVSGKTVQRMNDTNFPHDDVYSVQLEVHCIFKGAPLGQHIRINHVGSIPGHCSTTTLTVNTENLVYLRKEEGRDSFTMMFGEDPGTASYLDEMLVTCGITVEFPTGVTRESSRHECPNPDPLDSEDCIPLPTEAPPPTETSEPPMPPSVRTPPVPLNDPQPPKNPAPTHGAHKPAQNGASYESVVEKQGDDADTNTDGDDGRDAASHVTFTWSLVALTLATSFMVL